MPEPFRLTQQPYVSLSQQISDLIDSLRFLQAVIRGLSPGTQVSVEAAYQEMFAKTDTALRVHVEASAIALAMWDLMQRRQTMKPREDATDAHGGLRPQE